jgi:hypothetical protein
MQFSVIRQYAATRFRDPTNVIVSDADWKNYVNTSYGDTNMRLPYAPWNELSATITINAGVRSGPLPTDVNRVTAVWNSTDQFPMVPLEGRMQVFNEYPQQIETGQSMHYRIFGNALYVYPLPQANTSFTVEYLKAPADLLNDADIPAFPETYHDILVSGAVALAYRDDGNIPMAQEYDKEAEDMVRALIQESMQPRQDRYYEITDQVW